MRLLVLPVMVGLVLLVAARRSVDLPVPFVPTHAAPGATYTITFDCPTQPTGETRGEIQDVPGGIPPFVEGPAGTWTASAVAGQYDLDYVLMCGSQTYRGTFDADAPRIFFGPFSVPGGSAEPPTEVDGTDCPPGTTPTVTVGVSDYILTYHPAIDGFGNWHVPLPAESATAGARVTASCGSVTYPVLVRQARVTTTIPPTTTSAPPTTVPPGTPPPPPPATPRPGTGHFTG